MVEPALHGPVEVCLFLLLCSDFVIVPGRGGGFFPFSHKISSFFCFGPYYYAVSRKIFFRISFGFSRYYLMLLYKTFWNLYKTKYFLYKNRREFRHVFSGFSGSFYADCGFFCFFLSTFPVEKSVFFNPTVRQWQNLFLSAVYFSCLFRMIR